MTRAGRVETKTPSRTRHCVTPTALRSVDEDLTRSASGETDDAIRRVALERTLVHR